MKKCRECGRELDVSAFYTDRSQKDHKTRRCKECIKKYEMEWRRIHGCRDKGDYPRKYRLKEYGLTLEDFREMLKKQEGKCYLCGASDPKGRGKNFHVDHDHKTNRVRALLCSTCNMGLGFLRDDPELMRKAAEYVESFRK